MKSWTTSNNIKIHNLTHGFYNAYLIDALGKYIIVDTARVYTYRKILKKLVMSFPDLKKLDYLFLTHTHFDHCENAKKLKNLYKTKVVVGKSENESLKSGYTILPKGTNGLTNSLSNAGHKILKSHFTYDPVDGDILIEHEQLLQGIDDCIYVLPTPGHTIGSISLIINNEIALVGDAMFGARKNIYPPFADDIQIALKSWEKLINTGCHIFLSGHGKEISKERVLIATKKHFPEPSN